MTKKKTDPVVKHTFQVHERPEGPYRLRTLSVVARRRTPVSAELRDCRSIEERAAGLDHHFTDIPDPAAVRVAWLEREEDGVWLTCSPDVDAGESYLEIRRGLELLEKLGKVVRRHLGQRTVTDATFADPSTVIAALRRSNIFVEVEPFAIERRRYWVETCPSLAEGKAA